MAIQWSKGVWVGLIIFWSNFVGAQSKNWDPKTMVLIDVRTPQEYSQGHVKSALNIDVLNPQFEVEIARLDTRKTYAVYCRSGGRARRAAQIMRKRGLNVIELGGFQEALEKTQLPCEGCH